MFHSVVSLISTGIRAALSWFGTIFDSVAGAWTFFLCFFLMFVSFRSLLLPLIGRIGGSFHENRKVKNNE